MKTRAPQTGFSLVELLVVLAIIAIMAGISIPLFARSSFLQNSDLQNGSRELYAMLRAAKIYAVDHHVDTAVVYNLNTDTGSIDGEGNVVVGTGLFVARGLSPKERRALGKTESEARNMFIRVRDSEGEYHPMTEGTCILNVANFGTLGSQPTESEVGVTLVRVYDSDEDGLGDDDLVAPTYAIDSDDTLLFPAHVFTSSGLMVSTRQVPTQGVVLKVAPVPSADSQERASYDANGQIEFVDTDNDGDGDTPKFRYIGVEIKPTLGRVKIASDEDYT